MSIFNSFNSGKLLILFILLSISFWNCNDCEEIIRIPLVSEPSIGEVYIVNKPFNSVVTSEDLTLDFEWSCEPKESAKIEKVNKFTCSITPTKSGELKVSISAKKNSCYSNPVIKKYNIVESNSATYIGTIRLYDSNGYDQTKPDTVIIEFMDKDYLSIKGRGVYYGNNQINMEILKYARSGGVSQKNGTAQYVLDTKNKTLEYKHCSYFGVTACSEGFYKLK